jgi:hypothetical protein
VASPQPEELWVFGPGEPSHDDWLPLCTPPHNTMSKPDTKSGHGRGVGLQGAAKPYGAIVCTIVEQASVPRAGKSAGVTRQAQPHVPDSIALAFQWGTDGCPTAAAKGGQQKLAAASVPLSPGGGVVGKVLGGNVAKGVVGPGMSGGVE